MTTLQEQDQRAAKKYAEEICPNYQNSSAPVALSAYGAWNGFHAGILHERKRQSEEIAALNGAILRLTNELAILTKQNAMLTWAR